MQELGCWALHNVAVSTGACQAMVASRLAPYPHSFVLPVIDCTCLGWLWAEARLTIAARGGIERVVAAMAAHVEISGVQRHGCGVLRNVASDDAGAWVAAVASLLLRVPWLSQRAWADYLRNGGVCVGW